jgi:hypothetical protein
MAMRRTTVAGVPRWCARVAMTAAVMLACAWTTAALAGRKPSPPVLAGVWELDTEHSETLKARLEEAIPPGMFAPGVKGAPYFDPLAGPPPTDASTLPPPGRWPPGMADSIASDPALALLARPPLTLLIEESAGFIVLRARGEVIKTLRLPSATGLTVLEGPVLVAEWIKERRLEARGRGPRHGRLIETYELVEDDQTLVIMSKVEAADRLPDFDIERVYRRVKSP